ncbi:3D domain-containing protein [Caloranaerobacter ferrireducens]|uniref:3D domain-containing protein n=1 Tax=Caloranaerobacter ferrireducens TaxID=1323370 RepID=UPI00084D6337|nr:3D domain-containing protein [Caloranaerobacter ferrireducens]
MSINFINKKILLLFIILFIPLLVILGVYKSSVKEVSIIIDGKEMYYKTTEKTVEELFNKLNINLNEEDYVSVELDEKIKNGMVIEINKAAFLEVFLGNRAIEVKTPKKTVKEVLDELSIAYDEDDYVIPGLNSDIVADMKIRVVQIDKETDLKVEAIPYEKITRYNDNLEKGKVKKIQSGKNGIKEIEISEIYKNNKLISKYISDERIVQKPIPQILEIGTKDYFVSSRGNVKFEKSIIMSATAYDLSYESTGKRPGDNGYGITAMGTKVRYGVVAVDPKVIPLGTKLYVQSLDGTKDYGFAVAEDTGGAIKGNKIDLFFESRSEALAFGRRKVKVYILSD